MTAIRPISEKVLREAAAVAGDEGVTVTIRKARRLQRSIRDCIRR
jgi:hypothetical protein